MAVLLNRSPRIAKFIEKRDNGWEWVAQPLKLVGDLADGRDLERRTKRGEILEKNVGPSIYIDQDG